MKPSDINHQGTQTIISKSTRDKILAKVPKHTSLSLNTLVITHMISIVQDPTHIPSPQKL